MDPKRPASAHQGRPATDFVRVDRFTEEEKAQILADAQAERRERAEAQPDAWEGLDEPQEIAEPTSPGLRRVLVVLVVLALVAILALVLLGLAGLGAWIALTL